MAEVRSYKRCSLRIYARVLHSLLNHGVSARISIIRRNVEINLPISEQERKAHICLHVPSDCCAALDAAMRTLSDLRPRPGEALQSSLQVANNSEFHNSSRKGTIRGKSFLFDNLIVQTNHLVDTGHSSPRRQTKTRPFP